MTFSRSIFMPALFLLAACGEVNDLKPPSGSISYTCDEYVCTFEATGTNGDTDGNLGYNWRFPAGIVESGKRVRHVFRFDGENEVTLTTVDRLGNSSTTTETVTVSVPQMSTYLPLVRGTIATLMLNANLVMAADGQVGQLQTATESQLAGASLPASLQCPESGNATLDEWEDSGSDSQVGSSDELLFILDNCSFDAAYSPLTAVSGIRIIGDVRTGNYSLDNSFNNEGLDLGIASNFVAIGNFGVTQQSPAEQHLIDGEFFQALRFNDAGTPVTEYTISGLDMIVSTDYSKFFGEATLSSSTLSSDWTIRIDPALEFSLINGEWRLTAGRMDLTLSDGTLVRVTPDADPDFVHVAFFQSTRVTPNVEGQLAQRFVLEPFDEF